MGDGEDKKITGEEHGHQTEARRGDINQRMQELKDQIERNIEEISQEMIQNTQEYNHLLHARMENTQEHNQIPHEPIGYTEDMRVTKEEEEAEAKERKREIEKSEGVRMT